ncbi:protein SENSITIVE TO UV 2 isoform X2 [Ipomoea triloba]|uniref:protein SENSITIVE TO UV 2 isoform X2 n=1 Tax=Ipomoea triloba TaxID=35885 RepID=UPI00125D620D|nr:protein SENSITIVE TO UV 2 isoform X2 [Ipomoea triloba]
MDGKGYDYIDFTDEIIEQIDQTVIAVQLASGQLRDSPLPPPPAPQPQPPATAAAPQLVDTSHSAPRPAAAASQFVVTGYSSRRPAAPQFDGISYSPPREFSQRDNQQAASSSSCHGSSQSPLNAQQQEIDELKRELGRFSELLAQKELECIQLRKEREKKEKCVVKTEKVSVSTNLTGESDFSAAYQCKKKLLDAWESSSGQKLGRILVSETCEADFRILFGFLDSSFPSKKRTEFSISDSRVDMEEAPLQDHLNVSAKVSHLYSVLTKISNEMISLDDLLDALVDLCRLKNVVIVYRALHILHEVLSYTSCTERREDRRSNVIVEEPSLEGNLMELDENGYSRRGSHAKETVDHSHALYGAILNNSDTFPRTGFFNPGTSVFTSSFNYLSLFEMMCQIIMMNDLEHVRWEAVSIMNLILVRNRTYSEREKFGSETVFLSVSQLLRKEAGYRVQKQAVCLLYLLLNCPKVMASFFSNFVEGKSIGSGDANAKDSSAFQVICRIFEGLADCLSCSGRSAEELQVQRHSIILLAFLASSGKTGIEVLLNHRLPKRINFLTIILQSLVSVLDVEALDTAQHPEESKERTLMIREALILLNRLVSHPQYAGSVFLALTNRREIAKLTVDIASILSHKGKCLSHCDSIIQQIRESEIVELARVFQKRVYTFLGSNSGKKPS